MSYQTLTKHLVLITKVARRLREHEAVVAATPIEEEVGAEVAEESAVAVEASRIVNSLLLDSER